ncbi:MAG: DUF2075 domain-containing protein [Phycisphaerales bacterium]|nr:DUF2075 domain-containing protein [Phycisphaerales bacterium]
MALEPDSVPAVITERAFYSNSIAQFLTQGNDDVLGSLTRSSPFDIDIAQRDAWLAEVEILRNVLTPYRDAGWIAFEFAVPRVGRRIDALVIIRHTLFVIEFKVGAKSFANDAIEQVWDYALDLKNFHSSSHDKRIAPILVATRSGQTSVSDVPVTAPDGLLSPLCASAESLPDVIRIVLAAFDGTEIDAAHWARGHYLPTPTIVEAAIALYGGHGVHEISRSDASARNLSCTSEAIETIIQDAKRNHRKAICFVTGVPGAGKTLVGLNIATRHLDSANELYSVFLSGNGPLVAVLREALARDRVHRLRVKGRNIKLGSARSEVKAFIQNVHHFRDDCLADGDGAPIEHVALFDEAQRAWNKERTVDFMTRKKKQPNFVMSEPEFLISCMDRHDDWAVVVCLVGGGQEINTGEAGIGEWIQAILRSFPKWEVHLSPQLRDSEYAAGQAMSLLHGRGGVHFDESLHLSVSIRSFRAERVSDLVKQILDIEIDGARALLSQIGGRYPIVLTRDIERAKSWLKSRARGSERYGIVVSSQALRLKPHAIDVRAAVNPIHWFLHSKEDVRSSYYLEDVATEFHVQGLELDWSCVVWDGDFRYSPKGWRHWSFRGKKWQRIRSADRQLYQKNAYRVLLTRARQGMVVVVPHGEPTDPTRSESFYDDTYEYLRRIGLPVLQ